MLLSRATRDESDLTAVYSSNEPQILLCRETAWAHCIVLFHRSYRLCAYGKMTALCRETLGDVGLTCKAGVNHQQVYAFSGGYSYRLVFLLNL